MSLRWRLTLILAGVALAVSVVASTVSYLSTASQLSSGIDETLRSRATEVNTVGREPPGRGGRDGEGGPGGDGDGDCPSAGLFQPASAAQIVSPRGTVSQCIAGGVDLPVTEGDREMGAGAVTLRTVSIDGQQYRVLSTPWHGGGTLQIARNLAETQSVLSGLRLRLAALVCLATAVAAALGWAVARRIARPITRLRDTSAHIATTLDMSTPIDVSGTDEVGSLAASFSTMVAAVANSQEQQRRLVSDASHEMRTPMTSLRSNVELLRQIDRLPEEDRQAVVADVLEDIDELSSLLGELVDLASDLAAAEPEELVSLGDLARVVAARAQRRIARAVTVDDVDPVSVVGRPRQLERAMSNLVDNAIKYSEVESPIEISVYGPVVTVRDRGRGIPEDDLGRIFDRFHRAVDVRTEPGSGLGLSIVEQIVHVHGGRVFARNREGGGAEVGFSLPLNGSDATRAVTPTSEPSGERTPGSRAEDQAVE